MKRKKILLYFVLFFSIMQTESKLFAETLSVTPDTNLTEISVNSGAHDVKFIVETSGQTANWEPGTSKVVGKNMNLIDYDTEGLKLYTIKGKVNIFDTDVLEVEKFGTFSSGETQNRLKKFQQYNKDSALDGVNISLRAFLLVKYFYLYKYDFLDDIEYQYDYYNFYAKATNNLEAVYYWGKGLNGAFNKDYILLPEDSKIELTTEFTERRLYVVDFKSYVKHFFLDTLKAGYFYTDWRKESFVGTVTENEGLPVIQNVFLKAEGISLLAKKRIKPYNLDLMFRYNYGIDNRLYVSYMRFDADYYGIDMLGEFQYEFYKGKDYTFFTKVNMQYSAKWFDNKSYTLDTETLFTAGVSLGIIF